jgi:hypothetical protein
MADDMSGMPADDSEEKKDEGMGGEGMDGGDTAAPAEPTADPM